MTINTLPGDTNYLDTPKPNSKKDFLALANQLRAAATQFPEYSQEYCEKVTFDAGGFKIKCQPNYDAVNSLADKITKGIPKLTTWTPPRLPCVKPYTDAQKANVVARYRKEAHNLKYGSGNTKGYYPNLNIKQQTAEASELQDFAAQIESSIDCVEEAIAA